MKSGGMDVEKGPLKCLFVSSEVAPYAKTGGFCNRLFVLFIFAFCLLDSHASGAYNQNGNFYGFHIHEGGSCTGDATDPFKDAGGHYNPTNQEHPFHAGDMPVIMGNQGAAWFQFYTNRFYPEEIVGKTVVVHDMPDDFRSQPSGDSGVKIACGRIREYEE